MQTARPSRELADVDDTTRDPLDTRTLVAVFTPGLALGAVANGVFPVAATAVRDIWPTAVSSGLLGYDPAQFIQNFLTVTGLLFSLLIGNTFVFLYTQQESVYYALFNEAWPCAFVPRTREPFAHRLLLPPSQVSVAKALVEQVSAPSRRARSSLTVRARRIYRLPSYAARGRTCASS